jgi:calcium-dependent protein kinase
MPKVRGKLTKQKTLRKVKKEIDLLSRVQECNNVVSLVDVYQDDTHVYVVMELCHGGDLERVLEVNGPLTEHQAAFVLYEVLKVIATCHANNIVHGDVKPANFMLKDHHKHALRAIECGRTPAPWLKAIDFGCSQAVSEAPLYRRTGTPVFMAPEVFRRQYGPEADLWSLGMMFYQLIAARFPFWPSLDDCRTRTLEEVMNSVIAADIPLDYGPWLIMSNQGLDLFQRLTHRDPGRRITAAEALEHPWFKTHFKWKSEPAEEHVLRNNILPMAPACSMLMPSMC